MKSTRWKHLFRSIRKSGVSFLAVAVIAAVSIAIFQGFQSSGIAILKRADRYFADNNLETLEISCANGITEEDIEAIAGWEGVTAVEGGYTDSVIYQGEEEKILVQARSLLDTINVPVVLEGTLPKAADEVAIEEIFAKNEGVKVGDVITLENDGNLTGDTFEVTAVINIPVFNCADVEDSRGTGTAGLGSNEYYVCLTADAFDSDYYSDCFTTAYIDSSVLDGVYYYSDEYADGEAEYLALLEPLAQERAQERYTSLQAEVQEKLDDGQQELDDAQAEIADNEEKLADAKAEIETNQVKIQDAEAEIAQAEQDLASAQSQLNEQWAALESSRSKLNEQLAALGLGTDLNQALAVLDGYGVLGAPLKAAILEYQAGEAQLQAAQQTLNASQSQIDASRQELADSRVQLAEAEIEVDDAEKELEDAKQKVADAEKELADAKEDAAELQLEDWILSGRENVGDVRGIATIVEAIFGLSCAMALLFLLVAVVVCFAAITRVIREQRVLIGAQKALGFTAKEIFIHYTLYNMVCAVLGILLGWFLSVSIVELMSLNIFVPKFLIGSVSVTFVWNTALVAAGLCLLVFLGATYLTCSRLVKEPATDLLRGETPTSGKRMFFENWSFYKNRNLYSRTMLKNALNDKGRLMTTVVGIMGCTALLVACFSMKLGIQNASQKQFDEYASYDYRLVVDSESGSVDAFEQLLNEEGLSYTLIQDKMKNFRTEGGNWENAHVIAVSDPDALAGYMNLVSIDTGETVSVPDDGVLVSRRAAETMGLSEGSIIELMDENGRAKEFAVVGVIEHYLPYHLLVTSETYYETNLGEESDSCVFLLEGDVAGLQEKVQGMDGFLALKDNSEYDKGGEELDLVIGICTILSAVMSVLVLLNQITMYIDRKARELAVMRINGYTLKQTKAYVYKDNIVLIVLGLLVGCVLGIAVAYWDIRIIEAGAEHFVRSPSLIACLLACVIGAVFALIVNVIALRKINHLNLTNVSSN